MVEETLVLLKPDALEKGLVDVCVAEIEGRGLEIVARRNVLFTPELLAEHYRHLVGSAVYPRIEEYMLRGPCLALVVRGESAVMVVRDMAGATIPTSAAPGSLRRMFGEVRPDGSVENVLHASAEGDSAVELLRFFPDRWVAT